MSNFYRPTFPVLRKGDRTYINGPINFDDVKYFYPFESRDEYNILFKVDNTSVNWSYPTVEQRDYEYTCLLNMCSLNGRLEKYNEYLINIKNEEPVSNNIKNDENIIENEPEIEDVYVFKDDEGEFFVTKNRSDVDGKYFETAKLIK